MDFSPLADPTWELQKIGCFYHVGKECLSQRWIQTALFHGGEKKRSVSKCHPPRWLLPGERIIRLLPERGLCLKEGREGRCAREGGWGRESSRHHLGPEV